jgi:hypothetical protein
MCEMIEAFHPVPSSYLGDVLRLSRVTDIAERLMSLVLQKADAADNSGRAMLAVQASEREHNLELD